MIAPKDETPRVVVTEADAAAFLKRAAERKGETAMGDLAAELTAFRTAAEAASRAREEHDPVLLQVIALFLGKGEYTACSHAQRKLGIGYNEAARHIETLEAAGVVSKPNSVGKRTLLVSDMREARAALTPATGGEGA